MIPSSTRLALFCAGSSAGAPAPCGFSTACQHDVNLLLYSRLDAGEERVGEGLCQEADCENLSVHKEAMQGNGLPCDFETESAGTHKSITYGFATCPWQYLLCAFTTNRCSLSTGPHHMLKGGNCFYAGCAVVRRPRLERSRNFNHLALNIFATLQSCALANSR